MPTFIHRYQDQPCLLSFIQNLPTAKGAILLQVFSGELTISTLTPALEMVQSYLPQAHIVGASTAGEINQGEVSYGEILFVFSLFEQTQIIPFYFESLSLESGAQVGQLAIQHQAQCAIVFANTLNGQPQFFLDGINQTAPTLKVAGGNAADGNRFEETFVIYKSQCHTKGAAGVLLINPNLEVHQDYVINWSSIGPLMTITACDENGTVYEIDHRPIAEVYAHYLGDDVLKNLPESAISFPLMKMNQAVKVGRSMIGTTPTKPLGFTYAGVFKVGDEVRFGIADVDKILIHASDRSVYANQHYAIESLFIYSCSARNMFLGKYISPELKALGQLGTAAGFFTYGEYFAQANRQDLLNITTTFLTLSEAPKKSHPDIISFDIYQRTTDQSLIHTLTHLSNVVANELQTHALSLEQYRDALDCAAIVSKADLYGNITYVNEAFCKISGYSESELLGQSHNIVRHPDTPKSVFKTLWETIQSKQVWQGSIKNKAKEGHPYFVKSLVMPLLDSQGEICEYISIRSDVTEYVQQKALLDSQFKDETTGLPNRKKLTLNLKKVDVFPYFNKLLMIDIKGFRYINQFYGFDFGDDLILDFVEILKDFCHNQNLDLYRVDGDSFGLLPCNEISISDFETIAHNIREQVESHIFIIRTIMIELDIRLGIGAGTTHLLRLSESALNHSKNTNNSEILIFTDEIETPRVHMHWIQKIREALVQNRIVNYYQAIANVSDPTDVKYEALVRMIAEDGKIISPFFFLDVAKQSRYYLQITKLVVMNALNFVNETGFTVSVNLSIQDIEDRVVREFLLRQLSKVKQGKIIFEITESESVSDYVQVQKFIEQAKSLGAEIAIDDFGSGYSNFSYLVQMKADYLKIDGEIIKKIIDDENSLLVAESIIDIASKLKIKVIAEFVSNEKIQQKLAQYQVHYLQGYHIAEPMPAEKIKA